MKKSSKSRILYVAKILFQETDDAHPMTLQEIQQHLAEEGITCERKALYRDFSALEEVGFKIGRAHTRPVSYYLASRLFEPSQMLLLADAVQTSRSITKANSNALIRRLKKLVSRHDAHTLDTRVHVTGRVKMQNESIFQVIDVIRQGIKEKRDITFSYMKYDTELNMHDVAATDGRPRIKTPLFLVYNNENYYLVVYDDHSKDNLRNYRVDRIRNIMLLDKSPQDHKVAPDFNIADYEQHVLGMYDGKPEPLCLLVTERLVGNMVDVFGIDNISSSAVPPADAPDDRRWALMHVKAAASPVLFGRVAHFGGDVRITAPSHVVEAYRKHLRNCLA